MEGIRCKEDGKANHTLATAPLSLTSASSPATDCSDLQGSTFYYKTFLNAQKAT